MHSKINNFCWVLIVCAAVLATDFISFARAAERTAPAGQGMERWVSAKSGLRLRKSPDMTADIIIVIPYASRVRVIIEMDAPVAIDGITAAWAMVSWEDKQGWVFGGYLANADPEGKDNSVADDKRSGGRDRAEITDHGLPTGGVHDSIIRFAGILAFGSNAQGGIINDEKKMFHANAPRLKQEFFIRDLRYYNATITPGLELDVMLPCIKFRPERSFDFTGIKFSVRTRYVNSVLESNIEYYGLYHMLMGKEKTETNDITHTVLDTHKLSAGPVFSMIFSNRPNTFSMMLNLYGVAGGIVAGKVNSTRVFRGIHIIETAAYGAHVRGYSITTGIGLEFAYFLNMVDVSGPSPFHALDRFLKRWLYPNTLGVNFSYTYSKIDYSRPLTSYFNHTRGTALHELGGEISLGKYLL